MDSFNFRELVRDVSSTPDDHKPHEGYRDGWVDACTAVLAGLDEALRNVANALTAEQLAGVNVVTIAGLAADVGLNKPLTVISLARGNVPKPGPWPAPPEPMNPVDELHASILPLPTRTPAMPPVQQPRLSVPVYADFADPRQGRHPIGQLDIDAGALPPTPGWLLSLGYRVLEMHQVTPGTVPTAPYVGAYELDSLAIVRDEGFVAYLRQVGLIPPDWVSYDRERDELLIHGKRYAAAVFGAGGFLAEPGTVLQLVAGAEDQVTAKKVDYEPDPQARWRRAVPQLDDDHVADAFIDQVKSALKCGREKGRGGWPQADVAEIHAGLHKSLAAGYPVDVAAYCMFLWSRGDRTEPAVDVAIAAASDPSWVIGALTPAIAKILGRPNFACATIAEMLRQAGQDVDHKAEAEQAAVIHYLLGLHVKHGDAWLEAAEADLKAKRAAVLASQMGG